MIIEMQKADNPGQIQWGQYALALHGNVLDDRGEAAVKQIAERSDRLLTVSYDSERFEIAIEGIRYSIDNLADGFLPLNTGRVILETTTLGFVEILLCCRAFFGLKVATLDMLYVEPREYRSPRRSHLLHRRDFELSSDVPGYQAIPGQAILLNDRKFQRGIFFLGYEEARLRRAFEDLQMIRPSRSAVTFGVPAFKPGWETDAIANNIGVIREQNIRGGLYFCGAENPAAVIEILTDIYRSLSSGEQLFVAPIGTKPHGIGVALFVSEHRDVGVIYDHPHRTADRTNQMTHWHLFSVENLGGQGAAL